MSDTCEMIAAHHSDCECALCRNYVDDVCGEEASGTHEDSVRVCESCGNGLVLEGFAIQWDPEKDDE